jgi:hypothetical protein
MKESLKTLRERVDGYSLELMQYGANETEHDIHWLEGMIEAERNSTNGYGANGGGTNGGPPGTEPTRFGVLRGETT